MTVESHILTMLSEGRPFRFVCSTTRGTTIAAERGRLVTVYCLGIWVKDWEKVKKDFQKIPAKVYVSTFGTELLTPTELPLYSSMEILRIGLDSLVYLFKYFVFPLMKL